MWTYTYTHTQISSQIIRGKSRVLEIFLITTTPTLCRTHCSLRILEIKRSLFRRSCKVDHNNQYNDNNKSTYCSSDDDQWVVRIRTVITDVGCGRFRAQIRSTGNRSAKSIVLQGIGDGSCQSIGVCIVVEVPVFEFEAWVKFSLCSSAKRELSIS